MPTDPHLQGTKRKEALGYDVVVVYNKAQDLHRISTPAVEHIWLIWITVC